MGHKECKNIYSPLVRRFVDAGVKLANKSPEADLVFKIDLEERRRRQEERQERIEQALVDAKLRDLTPEGREINKKIVEAVFLGPEALERFPKKEQKELRALYEGRSFLDLSPDNQIMFAKALVDY